MRNQFCSVLYEKKYTNNPKIECSVLSDLLRTLVKLHLKSEVIIDAILHENCIVIINYFVLYIDIMEEREARILLTLYTVL